MKQAYYHSTVENFLKTNDNEIIGILNKAGTSFASQWTITTTSWDSSIQILKKAFLELILKNPSVKNWKILLEYEIPRLGSRIDSVIIADDLIFVIEFKYDRKAYKLEDVRQVENYANKLIDFHLESKDQTIIPALLAPLAKEEIKNNIITSNYVKPCLKVNMYNFSEIIYHAYLKYHNHLAGIINSDDWEQSKYQPTPTIIEAARALFAGKKVETISNSGAQKAELTSTTNYLIDLINDARARDKKIICFVTGVPGAGKTLVGLDLVHEKKAFEGQEFNAAYFSGNGPLIKVLREALARDDYQTALMQYKLNKAGEKPTKDKSEIKIIAKIQNLHTFIKDGIREEGPPDERIVVFDEAQRCWDANHFLNQAKRNQNREKKPFAIQLKSEAELLFEFMSRHKGWAVIIALVGGGQEINTGEAGISEWGRTIKEKYFDWHVHISPQLLVGDSVTAGKTLFESLPENVLIFPYEDLHLKVSRRSFRAENLNVWVNSLLDNNNELAKNIAKTININYYLKITRNIDNAKTWLKEKLSGTKRIGILASSGAKRLRPYGINVNEELNEAYWFLNDERDIRSSSFLEITATEFAVQGLELDWICVCWDADLRRNTEEWDFRNFRGTTWTKMTNQGDRQFLLNTYRVLLTRAREGIIVFVPEGDSEDETRLPEFYDPIYDYLKSCGLQEI